MRLPLSALILPLLFTAAHAGPDDAEWEIGATFSSPSKNIQCAYYDAGGETGSPAHDQKSEMRCLRRLPSPLLVSLSGRGVLTITARPSKDDIDSFSITDTGTVLAYGQSETDGAHVCTSTEKGLQCRAGGKGFIISKAGVEKLK